MDLVGGKMLDLTVVEKPNMKFLRMDYRLYITYINAFLAFTLYYNTALHEGSFPFFLVFLLLSSTCSSLAA